MNQFFKDKATNKEYLGELNMRANDNGVQNVLIMVDGEGHMGDAAVALGCHSIRVNAQGQGGIAPL